MELLIACACACPWIPLVTIQELAFGVSGHLGDEVCLEPHAAQAISITSNQHKGTTRGQWVCNDRQRECGTCPIRKKYNLQPQEPTWLQPIVCPRNYGDAIAKENELLAEAIATHTHLGSEGIPKSDQSIWKPMGINMVIPQFLIIPGFVNHQEPGGTTMCQ